MREYFLNHSPISFRFAQNSKDFVVSEIPLYSWSGEGEHLILQIRKKNQTTWEMVNSIAKVLNIDSRNIGYGGLKDKHGLTIQYISIPRKLENRVSEIDKLPNTKVLATYYHKNKIKIGHLKGNSFFIRLKKVSPMSAKKIGEVLKTIQEVGIPNFFGYQRFGIDGENHKIGKEILEGKRYIRDKRKRKFFLNSYQSYLFNLWLSERIRFSKMVDEFSTSELAKALQTLGISIQNIEVLKSQPHHFKLLEGDFMLHYPHGKGFHLKLEELDEVVERFQRRDIVPSGLLFGKRVKHAVGESWDNFEKRYIEHRNLTDGGRRFAWIFPTDIEWRYREENFWFELRFTLPKGSYATSLIEEIAKQKLF